MTHQLPAYLGSAECKVIATHDDGTADVELLDTAAGLRLRLPKADLTEVTGPSELALSYEDLEAERDRLAGELYVAQEQTEDLRRQLAEQKPQPDKDSQ